MVRMAKPHYKVHSYSAIAYCSAHVETKNFTDKSEAEEYCRDNFQVFGIYKVKLWDLSLGQVEPNNANAKALILELV